MANLGNVVGLLKGLTPPDKKYVLWAQVLNPAFPDIVVIHYWDDATGAWTPVTDPTTQHWLRPVISNELETPPATPTEGDRYLVPEGATGVWAGQTDKVATYKNSAWSFQTPLDGFIVSVRIHANKLFDYQGVYGDGGSWHEHNFQVPVDLSSVILNTEKGAALGVATLDENSKVPAEQINGDTLPYNPATPENYPVGTNTIKEALDHIILQFGSNVSLVGNAAFDGDGSTSVFVVPTSLPIVIQSVFVGGQRLREGTHFTKDNALRTITILGEPIPEGVGIDVEYFVSIGIVDTPNTDEPQEINSVQVVGGVVVLDMENLRDKYFRLLPGDGGDSDFEIQFQNAPENGAYCVLEVVRSTNVNTFITFPEGSNMVNSEQNLDNGSSDMEVGGTSLATGQRRYHYLGILFTKPESTQKYIVNMQSSRSFTP